MVITSYIPGSNGTKLSLPVWILGYRKRPASSSQQKKLPLVSLDGIPNVVDLHRPRVEAERQQIVCGGGRKLSIRIYGEGEAAPANQHANSFRHREPRIPAPIHGRRSGCALQDP